MSDFISSPIEVVKVGEPLSNSDEISTAVEKGEIYKRGFEDARQRYERPKGKWNVISMLDDYVYLLCSECGKSTRLVRDEKNEFCCIQDVRDKIIACPYCGARMEANNESN